MQHQIASIATEIEGAKLLVYNGARRKMAGMPFTKQAAMAKLVASEVSGKSRELKVVIERYTSTIM